MTLPDIDSLSSYGGALNDAAPIVDPTTDRAAAAANKAFTSVSMMTHLAPRAWVRMTLAASTGALVLNNHDACWGSAPGVAPTLTRTGTGVFTVTWAASQNDEMNVAHTINLRFALTSNEGSTVMSIKPTVTAANVLTIRTFDNTNTAADLAGTVVNLVVF